ncbi:MAG TPA: MFS transporter, partial [Ktedonobacterales bacterium]
DATATKSPSGRLSLDFWKYWTGETISNLGSSFTQFALPLLVFQLTGSALNLAISTAATFVPYLLFGLVIGAWVDRVNRKRMMILVDVLMALSIASIPVMYFLRIPNDALVLWIYGVGFVSSTLNIFFSSGEFAAIPSLVDQNDLVTANGRIQASFAGATIVGPLLAGALLHVVPLAALLLIDASSFVVSACTLSLVRRSFNSEEKREKKNIFHDVIEGLRYVLRHPVLRNISAMMALVNFFATTTATQLVLFATVMYHATGSEISLLFAAGSAGTVVLSLLAGPLRKRWSFSRVALSALALDGLFTIVLGFTPWLYGAVLLMALTGGLGVLFNINTGSLRQAIVPSQMLGRVLSIAGVLAWSAIPLGALLGGTVIQTVGKAHVGLVYAGIGLLTFLIPVCFSFTPLGHTERYLPKKEEQIAEQVSAEEAVVGD